VNTNFSGIIPGLGPELVEGAPQISITNITGVSESGSKDLEQVIEANTAVTKALAKHTIKTGFSYLYDNHWNDSASSPARGSFSLNGHYSNIAFADFILGDPITTGNAALNNYVTRNLSDQFAAYVQDYWKMLPNLTNNMGIRYDPQWFLPNPYGNNSLYVPALKEVVVFGNHYPADAIPNLLMVRFRLRCRRM
jgi:outer membrane receptor protein involved in Fe transport